MSAAVCRVLFLMLPAQQATYFSPLYTERLADFADLLDDGQEEELEAKLDQVSEDYGCDVVVVTEETLDGAVPQDYADDFFDYNDYGMGEDKSGILFLITMSERKW